MAIDPLTAAYQSVSGNQPFYNAQDQAEKQAQSTAALQQMATQDVIQKQVQQENALKIQEQQRSQQEQQSIQDAMKDAFLQQAKSGSTATTPPPPAVFTSGADADSGEADFQAGVSGAPPPTTPAPLTSKTAPTNYADIMNGVIQKLGASGAIRPTTALALQQQLTTAQEGMVGLGFKKLQETSELHSQVGGILQSAYNVTDPAEQQQYWDAAWRYAEAHGEDPSTTGAPRKLPDDPTKRKEVIEAALFSNGMGTALSQQALKTAQEKKAIEDAQNKKDVDARAQMLVDKSDAVAKLSQAADQDTYDAIYKTLDPKVAATLPQQIPDAGMTDDFKRGLLQLGMKPEDAAKDRVAQIKEKDDAKKEADKQLAEANKPTQEKWIADMAAAAQPGATPAEKKAGAVAKVALAQLSQLKQSERPINNNTFAPPPTPAGADASKPVDISQVPEAIRGTVQAIIRGDVKLPPQSRNNPTSEAERYWTNKVEPTYSEDRFDVKKSFMSGKDADNVKSLNTVIAHLGALADNAGKLDNSEFKKYNNFGNWLQSQAGTDKTAPFTIDRLGVSSELATALKGGMASEKEVENWQREIDSSDTPQTLKNKIAEIAHVIGGRYDALEDKRSVLPAESRSKPLISPKAQAVLDRLSTSGAKPVPDAVKKLLGTAGVAPGIHKLSDGTSWRKAADGTITQQ